MLEYPNLELMELNKDLPNKSQTASLKVQKKNANSERISSNELAQLKSLFKSEKNKLWKYLQKKETSQAQK